MKYDIFILQQVISTNVNNVDSNNVDSFVKSRKYMTLSKLHFTCRVINPPSKQTLYLLK